MRGVGKIVIALAIVLLVSGMASAATLQFTAKDPADVAQADFDIIKFGAKDNGNTVTFWIEVRGKINNHPDTGYLNAYAIEIEGIDIVAVWYNVDGTTMSMVYVSTESSMSMLSPSDYRISGNRIEFTLDKALFQDIGSDYVVNVYTAHASGDNPTLFSYNEDDATYSSSASSGGSGSEGGSGGGGFPYWLIIVAIIIVAVIVVVVYMITKKKTQQYYQAPPQYPQYPPPPPQPPQQPPEQIEPPEEQE